MIAGWTVVAAVLLSAACWVGVGSAAPRQPVRARLVVRSRTSQTVMGGMDARRGSGARRIVLGLRAGWQRRSADNARRSAALELLAGFAAELRAGQPVRLALQRASDAAPEQVCVHAVGVARLGGDVPRALRRDAAEQRLPVLRSMAALWQVAEGSGAGLSQAIDRLCTAESNNEQVRRTLASELAGPKATSRVLAGLPIVGLILGSGLGAEPVAWLFGSQWGLMVLVAGVGLEVAGLAWTRRLTRSVEALL